MKVIRQHIVIAILYLCGMAALCSCNKAPTFVADDLRIEDVKLGSQSLLGLTVPVAPSNEISINFSHAVSPSTNSAIQLLYSESEALGITINNLDKNKVIRIEIEDPLVNGSNYRLIVSKALMGESGESFEGIEVDFSIINRSLELVQITVNGGVLSANERNRNIPTYAEFDIEFSEDIPIESISENVLLIGNINYPFEVSKQEERKYRLTPMQELEDFSKINLLFPESVGADSDLSFETKSYRLYTQIDSTYKFPEITEEALLTKIQEETFKYFWDFGHPSSGMARERNTSLNTVTTGGSGFAIMSMIVGVERNFITRAEAVGRWDKMITFLENADRFHGVWPHWLDGDTGTTKPFSAKDNGADLVETSFLLQGLLTLRQYLDASNEVEENLISRITKLWEEVEWTWFRKNNEDALYWHWSPEYNWDINLKISGHNETLIVYILAAASPSYSIPKEVYINGYARNGNIINGNEYYGTNLPLGSSSGGPLFFTHYSFLGLDPRNLSDQYANYWEQNRNHSLINRAYCIDNPQDYVSYSSECWGLTASDNHAGYSAHSPNNDLGVITPTAAISSIPYTPEESLEAIKFFYYILGDELWGEYGFFDAFNPTESWIADSYLAIDQGPIVCMIENYRSALLWDLFMSAPEVLNGLEKLGFSYQ